MEQTAVAHTHVSLWAQCTVDQRLLVGIFSVMTTLAGRHGSTGHKEVEFTSPSL